MTVEQAATAGYQAGIAAWRPTGRHAIPSRPVPGCTDAGREWFLGLVRGLEKAAAAHAQRAVPFDGNAYIQTNFQPSAPTQTV